MTQKRKAKKLNAQNENGIIEKNKRQNQIGHNLKRCEKRKTQGRSDGSEHTAE